MSLRKAKIGPGKMLTSELYDTYGQQYQIASRENVVKTLFPNAVIFADTGNIGEMTAAGVDRINFAPVEGTDGLGRLISWLGAAALKVPNEAGVIYNAGLHFAEPVDGLTGVTNPRHFTPEHRYLLDDVGEIDYPSEVTVQGIELRVEVDSLFGETGIDHSGRTVRIWLINPKSVVEKGIWEECEVEYSGGSNFIRVTRGLDQRVASTDPADYQVWLQGVSIFRRELRDLSDRKTNPGYIFLGPYLGTGAGNPPTILHTTRAYYHFSAASEHLAPALQASPVFPDLLTRTHGRLSLTQISMGVRIGGGDVLELGGRQYAIGENDVQASAPGDYFVRGEVATSGQLEFSAVLGSRDDDPGTGGGDSTETSVLIGSFTAPSGSPDAATSVVSYANKRSLGARILFRPEIQATTGAGAKKGIVELEHVASLYWARRPKSANVTDAEVAALDPETQLQVIIGDPAVPTGEEISVTTSVVGIETNAPSQHSITLQVGDAAPAGSGARVQVDETGAILCMIEGVGLGNAVINGVSEYDMSQVEAVDGTTKAFSDPSEVWVDDSSSPPVLREKYSATITDVDMNPVGGISFSVTTDKEDEDHEIFFWAYRRGERAKESCTIDVASSPPTGTLTFTWTHEGIATLVIAEESTIGSAGSGSPSRGPFKPLRHMFETATP